jgi:hypothetical protein
MHRNFDNDVKLRPNSCDARVRITPCFRRLCQQQRPFLAKIAEFSAADAIQNHISGVV